ncbi:Alpha/beta hydrolase fold-3 domain protein [Parafrankia sp. Ea1.12]|uniref:alpha/beta hydrolase n=1 Tax=Parafrankia sp. Ea1.12 TaxID=573499 RepID=UPI000DA59D33|nr:alpha/beta hydrolase [Parafrankia sp. Ea1.12]SQD98471.1 Alpha/beta hydrolase fold-3 domain protein [Parafrankia sp. Ea1.12]
MTVDSPLSTPRQDGAAGPPPPFDAEVSPTMAIMQQALAGMRTLDAVLAAREHTGRDRDQDARLARDGAFELTEVSVPGPPGGPEVSLLVCRPTATATPHAVLYFAHGGGMITGDNRLTLDDPLDWAQELGLVVVSVDYRLAPENPHPAPVEDCYAGLVWTAAHAVDLGVDPSRIIISGQSAGGGLAAATALLARDRGGPALDGQLLMCPMLDDRNDTPSARQMTGLGIWDRSMNEMGWTALLGAARGGPDVSSYAAPARATDLSALPPTFVDVGSAETFRDEDVAYASRIWQAGGEAELHVWPGGFHAFDLVAPQAALSRAAKAARLQWLRRLLRD